MSCHSGRVCAKDFVHVWPVIAAVSVAGVLGGGRRRAGHHDQHHDGGGTNNPSTPTTTTGVKYAKVKCSRPSCIPVQRDHGRTNVYWIDAETGSVGRLDQQRGNRVVYRWRAAWAPG